MIRLFHKKYFGFTAIEVTMVAAVIMILSLLILPLYRKRAAEAKIVAALDDMQGLAKSLMLANADTDMYFRPQDLDNTITYNSYLPYTDASIDIPIAMWNRDLTPAERARIASPGQFQGPYAAIQKTLTLGQLKASRPELLSINDGPIFIVDRSDPDSYSRITQAGPFTPEFWDNIDLDKIPIDPWGTPYIFFGPGIAYNVPSSLTETTYNSSVIYTLGPDGLPGGIDPDTGDLTRGDLNTSPTEEYFREAEILGTGDDLQYVF